MPSPAAAPAMPPQEQARQRDPAIRPYGDVAANEISKTYSGASGGAWAGRVAAGARGCC